jgi:hypothetical protein
MTARRRPVLVAAVDAALVVAFAAAGRRSHGTGNALGDVITVAAPFLVGLALGWAVLRLWRDPLSLRLAAPAWAVTVAVGFALRRMVFDRGLAVGFLVVATVFTAGTLLGWRVLARFVGGRLRAEPRTR